MNCQKIAEILDDGDSRNLSAAERRALDAHVAGCAECRAAFAAHEAMGGIPLPAMSADFVERCRQLVVAQTVAPARRVGGRSFVVVGLMLAGAAAAAFIGSSLFDSSDESTELTAEAVVAPEAPPATGDSTAVPPANVGAATAAATEAAADATASSGFTVAVSFRQLADDPEAMRATEGVYRALVDELRRIPNLVLSEVEPPEAALLGYVAWSSGSVVGPSVELAVDELEIATLPRAVNVVEITREVEGAGGDAQQLPPLGEAAARALNESIELMNAGNFEEARLVVGELDRSRLSAFETGRVDQILSAVEGQRIELGVAREVGMAHVEAGEPSTEPLAYDIVLEATGLTRPASNSWTFGINARSRSGGGLSSSVGSEIGAPVDASLFVRRFIASLRAELFPVDEALLAATTDRVLDRRLPLDEWLLELNRLKQMTARAGNTRLSDDVARAIVDMSLTITDPRQLSAFLRALEGVDDAVLVQPLGNALRNGISEDIRLEAAMLLARFREDPTAQAALEAAASADPSPVVRLNARWAALDEAGHRDLIVTTLLDTRLTDAERIEPLLLDLVWAGMEPVDLGPAIDVTVVNELSEMLRRQEQAATRARVLGRLWRESSPALTPLFVQRLNEDESEMVRVTVAQALGSRLDEPGVRSALEHAAASDPISSVREMASHSLEGGNDIPAFETVTFETVN